MVAESATETAFLLSMCKRNLSSCHVMGPAIVAAQGWENSVL